MSRKKGPFHWTNMSELFWLKLDDIHPKNADLGFYRTIPVLNPVSWSIATQTPFSIETPA